MIWCTCKSNRDLLHFSSTIKQTCLSCITRTCVRCTARTRLEGLSLERIFQSTAQHDTARQVPSKSQYTQPRSRSVCHSQLTSPKLDKITTLYILNTRADTHNQPTQHVSMNATKCMPCSEQYQTQLSLHTTDPNKFVY